jgi:hypothetical protein
MGTPAIENQAPVFRDDRDPYYEELNRLFLLYRLANLNARYYGCRAEKFERKSKRLDVLASGLAASALALILWAGPDMALLRSLAALSAGLSAVIPGVVPFFGWTTKIRDLRNQHFAYSQIFGQVEFAITEIRRAGSLSPEHVGLARMVHEAYMRVEALDELEPDQKLVDREDKKVRAAFPDGYLWTNF